MGSMFKATMADARLWRNLLAAISTLVEEADFNAAQEGIKLRSMDPSHVAMVDFEWRKEAFQEYTCDQPMKIRLNVGTILKLLKRIGSDESVTMIYDANAKKMNITLKGKITRQFILPTLDPGEEEVPTPKITFNSKVKMTADSLRNIVEDTQGVSDSVRFEASADSFVAKAATELSSATIEIDKGSESLLEVQIKEPSKATYNLNYLAEISKAGASTSEVVNIEFSTNMPIKLEFEIPDQGRLLYYLAPRIESE